MDNRSRSMTDDIGIVKLDEDHPNYVSFDEFQARYPEIRKSSVWLFWHMEMNRDPNYPDPIEITDETSQNYGLDPALVIRPGNPRYVSLDRVRGFHPEITDEEDLMIEHFNYNLLPWKRFFLIPRQ